MNERTDSAQRDSSRSALEVARLITLAKKRSERCTSLAFRQPENRRSSPLVQAVANTRAGYTSALKPLNGAGLGKAMSVTH
jgi:hypothetical protein